MWSKSLSQEKNKASLPLYVYRVFCTMYKPLQWVKSTQEPMRGTSLGFLTNQGELHHDMLTALGISLYSILMPENKIILNEISVFKYNNFVFSNAPNYMEEIYCYHPSMLSHMDVDIALGCTSTPI